MISPLTFSQPPFNMNTTRLHLLHSLRSTPRLTRRFATKPSDPAPPLPHPPSEPPNPPKKPSRVGTFYRNNTYPVLKSFLLALFTYQLVYTAWLKLEVVEEKHENRVKVEGWEKEVKRAVVGQKKKAEGVVEEVKGAVEGKVEEGKRKGWWPF